MGGQGSGNHFHHGRRRKKTTVEDCKCIDTTRWIREGILKAGVVQSGNWKWTYHNGSSFIVTYDVTTIDLNSSFLFLEYRLTWTLTGEVESARYRVDLTTTTPRFGGIRWWFYCPLSVRGRLCRRRVRKLYLPPRERYFGCRHCHELTYTSCQESHKHDRLYRLIAGNMGCDPGSVKEIMSRIGKKR